MEQIGPFDSSLQGALDGCRQDAQIRGFAVPWCNRCTATFDEGCTEEGVIDLTDSVDEGSDTSMVGIEEYSSKEGSPSEVKIKDVSSDEGADPPPIVEEN
jgi:hypothetical protein